LLLPTIDSCKHYAHQCDAEQLAKVLACADAFDRAHPATKRTE
jgi:hypothetical protein